MPARTVAAPDLYCITDSRLSSLSHEEQVREMLAGGARLIQFRDKSLGDGAFRLAAEKCLALCRWANGLLIVNDRIDIAASIGAHGVHIGQGDIPPAQARLRLGEDAIIGLSTHTREQFERALSEPVDYIAIGPVFGTTTKENPDPPPGMDLIRDAALRLSDDHRPLVLIGGITRANVASLREVAPRAFLASIGDILRGDQIADNVRAFRRALGR